MACGLLSLAADAQVQIFTEHPTQRALDAAVCNALAGKEIPNGI